MVSRELDFVCLKCDARVEVDPVWHYGGGE